MGEGWTPMAALVHWDVEVQCFVTVLHHILIDLFGRDDSLERSDL